MFAFALLASAVGYMIGVITGLIRSRNRINVADLSIVALLGVAVAALLNPAIFKAVRQFEIGNIRVELKEVKVKQLEQMSDLEHLRVIIPLLLPPTERQHLINIYDGRTQNYMGGHHVRSELRHLRYVGLLESKQYIAGLHNDESYNLSEFVQLTNLGRDWVRLMLAVPRPPDTPEAQ